jgi:signal transduction histidine kinase
VRFQGEGGTDEELEAALGEVDRLSLIVEELLVLSRAGEHELPAGEVDLDDAAQRAVERWRHSAEERSIGLEVRGAPSGGCVWCAAHDLDRTLDALIENAVRYSPGGSTVTIVPAADGIDVLDRGPGLEPGEEEVVFERFRRGSAGMRGHGGTGLGLPIARELSRQWGGEITLAPREGGGTRASIRLPRAEWAKG